MLLLLSVCARAASLPPLTRARAVTLVSRHGKTVYCEGTGLQNDGSEASLTDAPVALRPDTIFRIYSMSKPITSAALMTLYEEGKFQLSDPLWLHLGDAWKKDNMEVRHTAHVGRTRSVGYIAGLVPDGCAAAGRSTSPATRRRATSAALSRRSPARRR